MTKRGFDSQLHKQILSRILVDIYKNFSGRLGFKGGTCAYLFYNLPRISLDLDFDILEEFTQEDIDKIKIVLGNYGHLKEYYDKRYTVFFLLDYQKDAPNIKIELNKRLWHNNSYRIVWFLGVAIKIVDESTLITNKIIALSDRRLPVARDMFDVYYFLQTGYLLNNSLIEERTKKNTNDYLNYLVNYIQRHYTAKNILHGLGEVLDDKQKEWAKRNLIKETIDAIKQIVKK